MKKILLLALLLSSLLAVPQELVTVLKHPAGVNGPLIYDSTDSGIIACNPTCTLTTPSSTQVGDPLVINGAFDNSVKIFSVTGDGTWVANGFCQGADTTPGDFIDSAYTLSATSTGAQTLNITLSGNSDFVGVVTRYKGGSGSYSIDGTCQVLSNQSSGTPKTPSITTTQSSDLIISNMYPTSTGGASVTNLAGTGWTNPIFYPETSNINLVEDNRSVGAGTYQAQINLGSMTFTSSAFAISGMTGTGCKDVGYIDFTGTSGASVTTTILNNSISANSAMPGTWSIPGAGTPKLASAGAQGPKNSFTSCSGGASHTSNSATLGFSITGTGSAQTNFVTYTFNTNYSKLQVGFWYEDNLVATDTSSLDCALISAGSDFAAANCYGNGITRNIELETPTSGHSAAIAISPSTWYFIILSFNQNGTDSISVFDTSGTLVGSKTGAAENSPATNFSFGQTNGSSVTNTKIANWSSIQFSPFVSVTQ